MVRIMNNRNFYLQFIDLCSKLEDFTNRRLGELLSVSAITIKRWKNGTYAPHPMLRETIINLLKAHVKND